MMIRIGLAVACTLACLGICLIWGMSYRSGDALRPGGQIDWAYLTWCVSEAGPVVPGGTTDLMAVLPLGGSNRLFVAAWGGRLSIAYATPRTPPAGMTDLGRRRDSAFAYWEYKVRRPVIHCGYALDALATKDELLALSTTSKGYVRSLRMPLWFPLAIFLPYPAVTAVRGPWRRRRRRRRGLCASCGYSLRGLPHLRCPECGTENEPGRRR